jgi:hypothetical protein
MERAFEEKSFHLGNACKYLFNCISFPVTSSNFLVKRSHDVDCDELSHLINGGEAENLSTALHFGSGKRISASIGNHGHVRRNYVAFVV